MTIDKDQLKATAQAASQGHWGQDGFEVHNDDVEDYRVAQCRSMTDAAFIAAASPASILELLAENEALRKEREGMVLVPEAPSEGLLMSMAIRQDHGLGVPGYYDQPLMQRANHGVSHARMVECALSDMRKLHEEVVGSGFYSPGKESDYAAMAKEASHG
uniref:ead/Ea22-like family protein n=1 Tax=Pseudomonas laurentiana TaxID=2364649 RepID=UPI0029C8EA47|nr:ead/Ea22-like family protein [Pseudomonas laurentiana]